MRGYTELLRYVKVTISEYYLRRRTFVSYFYLGKTIKIDSDYIGFYQNKS